MIRIACDVLVLGGGLTGLMAAREAVRAGLGTAVLSDGMGASPWVHGFSVPLLPEDSAECFLEDTIESGQGLSDPRLAAALCEGAAKAFKAIRSMGLCFNRDEGGGYQLLRPLGASHPRVASVGNETGVAILKALTGELSGRANMLDGVRAVRLAKHGARVTGALAFDTKKQRWMHIDARAVVLATGGFCGIYPLSTNKRDSGGDGVAMALEAGAALCDMEFIQFEPSAAVWPEALIGTSMITTMFFEGAVLRNREGERFLLRHGPEGERIGKDRMARLIAQEIADGRGTQHGGVYFDATGVGRERLMKDYPMYVNRYRAVGIDLAAQKIELAPAPHTSLGGVRIDPDGKTDVEGLFACGEVAGALHGANRIGGSAGLETLVFGQRAGRAASDWLKGSGGAAGPEAPPLAAPETGGASIAPQLCELRRAMQGALAGGAGALREGAALARARRALEDGLAQLCGLRGANDSEAFQKLRLHNDMTAALMVCLAAAAREDSLGCHARADFPGRADVTYRVVIRKGGGSAGVQKEVLNG
jgi:aspartate oxidase